jgi:hypothetical protein
MYVENVYNYFHNFRISVKCATIKIEIAIENGRSLKLHQTRQVDVIALHIRFVHFSGPTTNEGHPTPMGPGGGCMSGQKL